MALDQSVFFIVNGLANTFPVLDLVAIFGAVVLLPLMVFLAVLAGFTVKRFKEEHWYEFPLKAVIVGSSAFIASAVLKVIIQRPRPYVTLQDVHLLLAPEHDFSFPSGHASVAFALGFFIYRHDRDWGIAFLLLASIVAISRVLVGVHYPLDILGGATVGWLSAWVMHAFEHRHWAKHNRTLRTR